MLPNFTDFMENKLGITFDTVKTSPYAIVASPFYNATNEESRALQIFTDNMYQTFLSRVADGRSKTIEEIHQVAQGRVWTGQKAVDKGLVDVLGGLDTAIALAAETAELGDDYKLVEYPKIKREFWEEILAEMDFGEASVKLTQRLNPSPLSPDELKIYKTFDELRSVLKYREPMARVPFMIHQ